MEQATDRTRFKDKILDNISKAIKSIQELVYYQSKDRESSVTLCNGDSQCHKLCENLDHALLHGLKQVAYGYWRVVKELSHKEMVKEIDVLASVTTDLGRGRAWLYVSLNEGLLESYIKLLCNNNKLLKKFYAKEALLLDEDRMNILLTHTSGLDCVQFQLKYDVPYLDLNAYPPRIRSNSETEDQVRSTTPQSFQNSSSNFLSRPKICASPTESSSHPASDSDSASVTSLDARSQSEIVYHMKASTISSDSGCPGDGVFTEDARHLTTPTETAVNIKERVAFSADNVSISSVGSTGDLDRHKRLADIIPTGEEDQCAGDSLEVIRVRSKKGNNHKPKKKKPLLIQKEDQDRTSKSSLNDLTESNRSSISQYTRGITMKPASPDGKKANNFVKNGTLKVKGEENGLPDSHKHNDNIAKIISGQEDDYVAYDSNKVSASIPKLDSGIDICDMATSGDRSLTSGIRKADVNAQMSSKSLASNSKLPSVSPHSTNNERSVQEQIESKIAELYPVSMSDMSSHKASTTSNKCDASMEAACPDTSIASNRYLDNTDCVNNTSHASPLNTAALKQSEHEQSSQGIIETTTTLINSSHKIQADHLRVTVETEGQINGQEEKDSSREGDDSFDVYSSSWVTSKPALEALTKSSVQSAVQLKDYMDYIMTCESPAVDSKDRQEITETGTDLSLYLDNNTKLQLMLDIFTHEDEKLLKMFVTRENHTEGGSGVVFVLISDLCLYLLHYRQASKKFALESSAMLQDLIFLATGINEQTLNIESRGRNNQKQRFWLTTGHQPLTLSIVACLTEAVRAVSDHVLPTKSRFSVESEVPLQTIALRKYISRELQCEVQDVTICDYSLVFWEDPSASTSQSHDADAAYKEGTLLIRSQDPLKPPMWKPVYVVLKNSMLCVSNNKSDPRPHSYLGLGGDQCVGCRATSTADREHCIELIVAQGGSWLLAAASQVEISEWRHALCLAVSQGTVDNNTLSSCVPCCAVLACNHLFLCHEDLHTKFYRTLGRAQLEDVTGIEIDYVDSSYCVIEFESQEAGVSSNQWVVYFSSAQDLERYKTAIDSAWRDIYQIELPVSPINNVALRRHCSVFADHLRQQLTLK